MAKAKHDASHTIQKSNPYNFHRRNKTNINVSTVIKEEANGESDNLEEDIDLLENSVSSAMDSDDDNSMPIGSIKLSKEE